MLVVTVVVVVLLWVCLLSVFVWNLEQTTDQKLVVQIRLVVLVVVVSRSLAATLASLALAKLTLDLEHLLAHLPRPPALPSPLAREAGPALQVHAKLARECRLPGQSSSRAAAPSRRTPGKLAAYAR